MRGLASASAHTACTSGAEGSGSSCFVQVGVEPEQRSQVVGAQFADVQNQSPGVAIYLFAIKLIAATAYGLSVRSLFGLDLNQPVPMPSRRWLPGARPSHKVFKRHGFADAVALGLGQPVAAASGLARWSPPFCNDTVAKRAGQANHALTMARSPGRSSCRAQSSGRS